MPDSPSPSTPRQTWQPPTAEELQVLLPQYEISEMLGRGGMGAVYKGRQIALDRPVAIKILSNLLDEADASFAERFKNEARAMGKLMHPGVVAVFDFGETADGLLYIVMEFVEGTDVSRMLARQKRLPPEHAMAITAHVLDALAYAHARGIIHRDIKPANVMVGYDGVVKVADFGLAKMTSVEGQSGLTQSGTAMGTLHYMAPESLMLGTSVDHRADIYAVGVMLYQMLTGKLPQGMFELPSLQVPGLDPRYDGIIAKALRDDRELRYQTAMEMRQDLDAILTQPVARVEAEATHAPAALPTTARPRPEPKQQPYRPPPAAAASPPPPPSQSRSLVWVAVLVLVVFGGIAWFVFTPPAGSGKALKETATTAVTPASATPDAPFVNSLGMKFVAVPDTGVLFCIHELRYKDYAAYATEAHGINAAWKNQTSDGYAITERNEDHPVVNVSWEDAQKFCAWLSKKEGKLYRLPNDEEWSCAVGIVRDEKRKRGMLPSQVMEVPNEFPWGGDFPPKTKDQAGNYSDESRKAKAPRTDEQYLENYDDGYPTTAPVMSYKPNKLGLYDLGGNVWEWCEDWHDSAKKGRVLRGGSWNFGSRSILLSSSRTIATPDGRRNGGGFRLVLVPGTSSAVGAYETANPPTSPLVQPIKPAATPPAKNVFTNSLGMKFVPVPGTDVLFCIHETRYKDYAAYTTENQGVDGLWKDQTCDGYALTERTEDHPVMKVSWEDAQKFCAWLSKKEGKIYRLPTDREWSYAVGIGQDEKWESDTTPVTVTKNQTEFPWGNQWPPPEGSGNFSDDSRKAKAPRGDAQYLDGYDDGFPTTAPVMSFKPNKFGLFDMGGNVWEWCEDWYDITQKDRVLRSGAWGNGVRGNLLLSYRAHYPPGHRHFNHGFRLVVAVPRTVSDSKSAAPKSSVLQPTAPSPSAATVTKEQPFVNALGMKFVPVPGTEVLFCIHETRRQDYAAYAAVTSGVDDAWKKQQRHGIPCGDKDDHPVCGINWEDAKKFCVWLSQKEGASYRLPTDKEWSIAVGVSGIENRTPTTTPEELAAVELDHFP
jgi:formylglycine-generating enzyme required for sulfatase activity/serine/threonine protein kinase